MELSSIIVIFVMSALFFGFIVWMAMISKRNNRLGSSVDQSESNFPETRKQKPQFSEK